tara:strand:+ start:332 stop:718 length:387 start_codon:yes stop_codon:yes gene_type:complete
MGYTNYWNQHKDFSKKEWNTLVNHSNKMINFFSKELDIETLSSMSDSSIYINGIKELGHEDFVFTRSKRNILGYEDLEAYEKEGAFNFCKTLEKPYDSLIWNILLKAYSIAPAKISISNGHGKKHGLQ